MARRLTQKQENFAQNIFVGMSQHEAYIKAGYSSNMLPATIDRNASALAKNSKIVTRIAELNQRAEDAKVADKKERKQILSEIARGRIGNLLDESHRIREDVPLDDASIQEINTFEVTIGKGENAKLAEVTKIKLHNPLQAIDLLNKMENIYSEQPQVNIDNRQINFIVRNQEEMNEVKQLISGISNRDNGHKAD